MPKSEKQKAKILLIARYLWEQTDESHGVSSAEIRDYLEDNGIEAEEHSIYRDIAALRDEFGLDIDGGRGKKYRLVSRDLEYDDLRTLAECVYATRFISEGQAKRIVRSLGILCSEYQRETLEGETFIGNRARTEERSVLRNADVIRSAIRENKKSTFNYSTIAINDAKKSVLRKNGKQFKVSPFCLLVFDGNLYLFSISEWSESFTYRVDRMRNVHCTEEARIGHKEFEKIEMRTYLRRVFGMYKGERQRVTMEFDKGLLDTVVDRLGIEDVLYRPEGKDKFVVNADIEVSPTFYAWILSFGKKAKIISPFSVVEGLKGYLQDISNIYFDS